MNDVELSPKLDRLFDDNTVDNNFIAHPDFVYDKLLELECEIKKLQAENAELKKQSQWINVDDFEAHLSDNDFCFVYFPCGTIKKCHLNDYRTYSGKGVYWQDMSGDDLPMLNTKFIKIEIPTPPEGE